LFPQRYIVCPAAAANGAAHSAAHTAIVKCLRFIALSLSEAARTRSRAFEPIDLGITGSEVSKCQARVKVETAPLSADQGISSFRLRSASALPQAESVLFGAYRGRRGDRSPLPILARDLHCLDHRILDAAMAKLARLVAFLLFIGSVGISIALMLHGSEWSEARAGALQDIRSAMTGAAFILFCIFMFTGKKRRRSRRYHPET